MPIAGRRILAATHTTDCDRHALVVALTAPPSFFAVLRFAPFAATTVALERADALRRSTETSDDTAPKRHAPLPCCTVASLGACHDTAVARRLKNSWGQAGLATGNKPAPKGATGEAIRRSRWGASEQRSTSSTRPNPLTIQPQATAKNIEASSAQPGVSGVQRTPHLVKNASTEVPKALRIADESAR